LVPKAGTVSDVVDALIKKLQIPDEAEGGRIRIYETSANRVYREPARDHAVLNLSDYTQIYAERVPAEEVDADDSNFIQVFHFQNEVNRSHGIPFKFLMIEGEKFADTKKRLEKRTGFKGKSFEKIKFALVRRANYSKPQYLDDGKYYRWAWRTTLTLCTDDELWSVATAEDDYLGLDHADRSRSVRNGGGDLFLR
jgi:ubiquitin carboxyl-terminal hydrolase 7